MLCEILGLNASPALNLRFRTTRIAPDQRIDMKWLTEILLMMFGTALLAFAAPNSDQYSVRDFGATGDGKTDDTAAFQKALDAAHQAGGGVVYAPRGHYF